MVSGRSIIYRKVHRPDPDLISDFRDLEMATVYEATSSDTLMDPSVKSRTRGQHVVGPAVTAQNEPGDNLAMHVALTLIQRGDVLVMTAGNNAANALWGEQTTLYAAGLGLAGVVTDGAVRDAASFSKNGFPVWARLISARKSTKTGPVRVNMPISCGGVIVHPGDLIVADDDGVVVVPTDNMADVLKRAKERKAAELNRWKALHGGRSLYELLDLAPVLEQEQAVFHDHAYSDDADPTGD